MSLHTLYVASFLASARLPQRRLRKRVPGGAGPREAEGELRHREGRAPSKAAERVLRDQVPGSREGCKAHGSGSCV